MSASNDASERRRVNKVTISPVCSGNTNALIVQIRKISAEVPEEDIPKFSNTFKAISTNTSSLNMHSSHSKHTMTDTQKSASSFSQTSEKDSGSNKHESVPCLKHAAENIGRKAGEIPSEKIKLCNDCSKSMLSYIFLVQDFLDGLAREISGDNTSECLQCRREEVRKNIISVSDDSKITHKEFHKDERIMKSSEYAQNRTNANKGPVSGHPSEYGQNRTDDKSRDSYNERSRPKRTSRAKAGSHQQESKQYEVSSPQSSKNSSRGYASQQSQKVEFIYSSSPPQIEEREQTDNILPLHDFQPLVDQRPSSSNVAGTNENSDQKPAGFESGGAKAWRENCESAQITTTVKETVKETSIVKETAPPLFHGDSHITHTSYHSQESQSYSYKTTNESSTKISFPSPLERTQPNYTTPTSSNGNKVSTSLSHQQSPSVFREEVDGIISTLSNVERDIYDSARNVAGWESLTEPSTNSIASEAYVTFCRNNAEAIGCLVVGTSLLLCRTSRNLCVLVSDGVSTAFRSALSAVFHTVQFVRSLDSLGTTKLSLLEQPDLGITFDKLNIWRLTQYSKCVYLNPDTLMIQNCDELFCREELSAVPDIGWPDCFNSGVFVFSPSVHTFWQLLEFAEKQGSFDGGDQGLLNSYFSSWSSDIHKKLSFIYNLMANVSYTYTPAFRQFGRDVKIVQFHGSFKPWHVKFFTKTCQVSPASPVHPTYVQFVHIWLKIFRISVLRLMSEEIQSYASRQEVMCAVEMLRFFPLPSESESEFFLTPPSVRVRLTEKKLNRSLGSLPISEAGRRKSAEFPRYTETEEESAGAETFQETAGEHSQELAETSVTDTVPVIKLQKDDLEDSTLEGDEVFVDKKEGAVAKEKKNALPGAEVGNYLGMRAWEQGRMDYQGEDSSDNVIRRLQFLMSNPKIEE